MDSKQSATDFNAQLANGLDAVLGRIVIPKGKPPLYLQEPGWKFRKETLEFLAYGQNRGRDYSRACLAYISFFKKKYRSSTAKQIASDLMKLCKIPSGYKPLMNDLASFCKHCMEQEQVVDALRAGEAGAEELWGRDETLPRKARENVMGCRLVKLGDPMENVAEFRYISHADLMKRRLEATEADEYAVRFLSFQPDQFAEAPRWGIYDIA